MPARVTITPPPELAELARSVEKGEVRNNPTMTADKAAAFKIATGLATEEEISKPRMLEPRFATLKKEIIREEDIPAVTASWARLKIALAAEVERIEREQQAAIPECEWADCLANGGNIPNDVAERARSAGGILFRGVVPEQTALAWKQQLLEYTKKHPGVGGRPRAKPTSWMLFWTKAQVEARSHPEVVKAQRATARLWNLTDESVPVDIETSMTYADRFRIRHPGDKDWTLNAHIDSSSIERWEDPGYRSVYNAIWKGDWENFDPWCMDARPTAKYDLYGGKAGSNACFRPLQGWISMSNTGPGEGTLHMVPSVKIATAYMLLRPFFLNDTFDNTEPTFPGAYPSTGQFLPTPKWHPDLELAKTSIAAPKVKPGDYFFWHSDVIHEVEDVHNGSGDSSVIYVPVTPLCPYNIKYMIEQRKSWRKAEPPADFLLASGGALEVERQHDDHGARVENILTREGRQGMGLEEFDVDVPGLTEGQRTIRRMANELIRQN